jgi:phage shock protein C
MPQKQVKRLYRPKDNRVIVGILGGIGEYLNVDPVLIRLVFVVLTVFTGFIPGIIFYFEEAKNRGYALCA